MGEVYLAHDTRLRRDVALKVLPPASAADASARRRLLDEARLGARLDHPNIAAIYDVGSVDDRDYIAMQRIPGSTLDLLLGPRPMPEHEALALAAQIAEAVAHAHASGVVHRDLKLQNVMVTPEGRAVVLDFGIARVTGASQDGDSAGPTLTATGGISGTPSAMSPEQARGENVDARTDVFSFGVLLYRMLSGRMPFEAASTAETVAAMLLREPPPLGDLAPGTSPELARIVHKCLEKDRALRYGSMREVAIDLERLRRGTTTVVPGPSRPARRPGRRTLAVASALAAVTIVLVILFARDALRGAPAIRTLAVLPFRSLSTEAEANYLGLGVADAVISRVSQDPGLVVRPTSAVRRYVSSDVDAAKAADELRVDAVLEGTWQRAGDRLRVTANLLRASDGASLWSERFDARSEDLFDVQDQISDQLASRLRTRLASVPASVKTHGGTRNPAAYEAYAKGLFYFSERGYTARDRYNSDAATSLFEEASRVDPNFALARANLAYAYVWTALFIENDSTLIERARHELAAAERIDARLGIVPFVRSRILYSQYSGWRIDEAIREFQKARRMGFGLDESEAATLHHHLGLEKEWRSINERALAQNPTNRRNREIYVHEAYLLSLPEVGKELQKTLLGEEPDARYWSSLGDTVRTVPDLESSAAQFPDRPMAQIDLAFARALQRRHAAADSLIRTWAPRVPRDRAYHHATFEIAQIYAHMGDADEAVRWLDETVAWGFPCLPLFERDRFLDPIRKSPAFVAFLARLRPTWERYKRELEG
jgi:TolB-like protein